jgi:hypothetical protein
MKESPRFIATGDIHGELEQFQEVLRVENLIDAENHWSGGSSTLLQIGDVIDRGPHSRESLYYIRALQQEAAQAGGRVIRLFGNHELLAMQGQFYYCNFEDPTALAEEIRQEIIEGKIQTAFLWKGRLFTHAGIRLGMLEIIKKELDIHTKDWDKYYEVIADYLNRTVKEYAEKKDFRHHLFWIDSSRGGIDEVAGVFWAHYTDLEREQLNPLRQVVGHTPVTKASKIGIRWTKDIKKINIDAGLTYCGNQAWIVVEDDKWIAKGFRKGKIYEKIIE